MNVTWTALCAAEPELFRLEIEVCGIAASASAASPKWCANRVWYGTEGIKARMKRLVGWSREGHPLLGTNKAYRCAYEHLYALLPDCRDCGCPRLP